MNNKRNSPKYLQKIESTVVERLKCITKSSSALLDVQQIHYDKILEIYRDAFQDLIENTSTYSSFLQKVKSAYENSLQIRNERIIQFTLQDKIFGITANKNKRDQLILTLEKENEDLKEQIKKLSSELSKVKKVNDKLKDNEFSEYLSLMRERDARYTLYAENLSLRLNLRALLQNTAPPPDSQTPDPVVLRIALDRCREQLSASQRELKRMSEEYAETVPLREHDALALAHCDVNRHLDATRGELQALQESFKKIAAAKKNLEEELSECRERCTELERSGTPRPHWELCADFISGGRDRWCQLARGLSSRDTLRALLKELGPAADSDHLEYFEGLGTDPSVPPYLRFEGRVRNLRLSRREVSVLINDIWVSKMQHGMQMPMQDYVTKYFEDRYQQLGVRAEWAYNLCAGAEQLDEPSARLFRATLLGRCDEDMYWGYRAAYTALKEQLYSHAKDRESITMDEFEKVAKLVFPLKSEVDIKCLGDVVRRQLKMKLASNDVNLDKLFAENEEGFEQLEISRELWRQRRAAQDKYLREVVAALRTRRPAAPGAAAHVAADDLRRALALVDPAIDHVCMERYVRCAFGSGVGAAGGAGAGGTEGAAALRAVLSRLAHADVHRVGPRSTSRAMHKRHYK